MAGLPAAPTRRSVLATLPNVVLAPLAAGGMLGETSVEARATISAAEPIAEEAVHIGAAENVSQALTDAIYDHCVAYAQLRRLSQETDAVVLGREPTSKEWRRLDMASDRERHLLMRLCARPASTDAERHAKASYLLALFDGDEPSSEHVKAILQAMLEPMPTLPGFRPGRSA